MALYSVKARDVKCPSCGSAPRDRCGAAEGRWLYTNRREDICDARKALARRVASLLRSHFFVAERPCNGEAHSNPFIDHCMVCMPRWGTVEYLWPHLLPAATQEKP